MPDALVAIVVTHNRKTQLARTLAALLAVPDTALSGVLVFDNASHDGTAEMLAGFDDARLQVVHSPRNLGGAGGFEAAMRAALTRFDPAWVVLMDDDARPDPGTLERFAARPRAAAEVGPEVWAGAVRFPDGRICDMNRPWINPFAALSGLWRTLRRGRDGFHLGSDAYEGQATSPIDGASFVGLFVARSAIARAGLPDGRLFLYGDDVLYALRLRASGARARFDPALRFEHDCTTLAMPRRLSPLWKVYYFHRNQVLVYRAAAGPVLFWPVLGVRLALWLSRARAYGDEARAYRGLLWRAVRDGLRARLDDPPAGVPRPQSASALSGAGDLDLSHAKGFAPASAGTGSQDGSGAAEAGRRSQGSSPAGTSAAPTGTPDHR